MVNTQTATSCRVMTLTLTMITITASLFYTGTTSTTVASKAPLIDLTENLDTGVAPDFVQGNS